MININIAELLKDAPVGLQLYSPLFGPVVFKGISNSTIVVKGNCSQYFDKYGRPCGFLDADCLLFPSKDCRTWEGWSLPVEPKFKVGSWLYHNSNGVRPVLVTDYDERHGYQIQDESGRYHLSRNLTENEYHLWSIQDAKDGDVITNGKLIVIFNKLEEPTYRQHIIAYVGLDLCGRLQITKDTWQLGVGNAISATKEQRDLLFKKIKEAGYEWDADKKELRKIKSHYDISNFHPGMPVLVRDRDDGRWSYAEFSHYFTCNNGEIYFNACGLSWKHCIPFKRNEALVGTRNPCKKEYINW